MMRLLMVQLVVLLVFAPVAFFSEDSNSQVKAMTQGFSETGGPARGVG